MLIEVSHPKFSRIELHGGTLTIHLMQGEARVLHENTKDVAVAVQDKELRIVAFVDDQYAWCFRGETDLQSEKVEFGETYRGGGYLVNDGQGNSHLFYFVKQSPGQSYLLRHQIFSDKWSNPINVSTNVSPVSRSMSASWHHDGYLHLVYCSHKNQQLLYRVYSFDTGVWSGAVTFSKELCSYPQFISAESLYLLWQEDHSKTTLNVRTKTDNWAESTLVSTGKDHVGNVGYAFCDNAWNVFWVEGDRFFQARFDNWAECMSVERSSYDYTWVVQDGLTLPFYRAKEVEVLQAPVVSKEVSKEKEESSHVEPEPEVSSEVSEHRTQEQERRAAEEATLQAAFVEQAFRTLKEWETVQEEMKRWQRELKMPEPVDLTPLSGRVERLERRFLTLKQSQEQSKAHLETNLTKVDHELGRAKARLAELEDSEKKRQKNFWSRVLGRG